MPLLAMEEKNDAIKYSEPGSTPLLTPSATGRATWRLYQLCHLWHSVLTRKIFRMVERTGASMKSDLTASLKMLLEKGWGGAGRVHFCPTVSRSCGAVMGASRTKLQTAAWMQRQQIKQCRLQTEKGILIFFIVSKPSLPPPRWGCTHASAWEI